MLLEQYSPAINAVVNQVTEWLESDLQDIHELEWSLRESERGFCFRSNSTWESKKGALLDQIALLKKSADRNIALINFLSNAE